MNAVAAVLLVLSYPSISHGWRCTEGPQQYPAAQIDAGQGKVVMTDVNFNAYFLSGNSWNKLGSVPLKHVSMGRAGIWGVDTSDKVHKYIAGDFVPASGLDLQQVDAGGDGQIVGVTSSNSIHCLNSAIASSYKQAGALNWNSLPGALQYFSCSPVGCWGVNAGRQIYFTKVSPANCHIGGWQRQSGAAVMVEVGTDGSVFVVNSLGQVFQRTGISSSHPAGNDWAFIAMCLPIKHVTYDLGVLWAVTSGGTILRCTK